MVKVKVTMSLNGEKIKQAKQLQIVLAGADNLSGLVDKLLSDWVQHTQIWNDLIETPDGTFKKLTKQNRDVSMDAKIQ